MEKSDTLQKIHDSAKRNFMAVGFQRASLRRIVSEAGYTLGAFYGYYNSKEELFRALVEPVAKGILTSLTEMAEILNGLPDEEKLAKMTDVFTSYMPRLVDFLMDNRDETYLLLECAGGTRYENFLSGMMEQNLLFMAQASGKAELPLEPLAQKLLVRSYFSTLGQAVLEGDDREEIMRTINDIQSVFTDGMVHILQKNREKDGKKQQ